VSSSVERQALFRCLFAGEWGKGPTLYDAGPFMNRGTRDTIAQIATASGAGGVGIVRISGPNAHSIGRVLVGLNQAPGERRMVLRTARGEDGEPLDEGLYVEFTAPRSFTGEAVAELQAHGGDVGLSRILQRCLQLGARAAEPGEFSLRAFENGRIDLAKAEAIAAAVSAQTEQAHRLAQRQYAGALSERIAAIRAPLVDAATRLNAEIEFPGEDLGELNQGFVEARLREAQGAVDALLVGFRAGRLLSEGGVVALIGPPNAGKSSLMNALLGYERAIVSPVAGTTRDTVEERVMIGGAPVRLVDTAGIRKTDDLIERAGVARAMSAGQRADVVVGVVSADTDWAGFAREAPEVLWVCNKCDQADIPPAWNDVVGAPALRVSARTGEGIGALRDALAEKLLGSRAEGMPLVTLERHARLLRETSDALTRALGAIGKSEEMILVDVGISIHRLGELIGENVSEEVYREIFRRFCIGK
jgi:tRNA modification GTPase